MTTPTMAAGFAAAFLDYAQSRGADRTLLLTKAGLTEDDLSTQDARVPVDAYQALILAGIENTGDTALLLRHTLESRLETMSIVGQIVHSSSSLAHSFEQLNRYVRLMTDLGTAPAQDRFELADDGTALWIVDHTPDPNGAWMTIEASFARFISEFRRSFPERVFELELEVTYPPPPHAAEYPDLFRVPARFNAPRNALRIDRAWLTTAFAPGNEYVFGIFTRHADELLAELDRATSTRARVEERILPELHTGRISMDRVARDLGMSRQTLYRRLQDEGVTFAEVHDALRYRMARDYLGARKVSVNETAYLLGFSEASSFVRAFRRWTGRSPSAFRESTA